MAQLPASSRKHDGGKIPGQFIVSDGVQFRIRWGLANGKTGFTVMGAKVPSSFAVTPAIVNTWITSVANNGFTGHMDALVPTGIGITGADARDRRAMNNPYVIATPYAGNAGTSASVALPPYVASVITLKTNFSGQANRGRVYLPCWAANADGGNGLMTDPAQAATNAMATALLNAFTAIGVQMAIMQPPRQQYTGLTGAVHAARAGQTTAVITANSENKVWDSQRRRNAV